VSKRHVVKEIDVLGLVASEGLNLDLLTHLVLIVCFVHVVKEIIGLVMKASI
jgi:hypothetical protein